MPYKAYTDAEKTEALDVLTLHRGDVQAARGELTQRWGHVPSISTLTMWLISASPERRIQGPEAPGNGITPPSPEARQNGALKGFEGTNPEGATPMQQLLSALADLAREDLVIIVIGKPGASGAHNVHTVFSFG